MCLAAASKAQNAPPVQPSMDAAGIDRTGGIVRYVPDASGNGKHD